MASGRWPRLASWANARKPARRNAPTIPKRSTSLGLAWATWLSTTHCLTGSTRFWRRVGLSSLESFRPLGKTSLVELSTRATPTVAGPAKAPRPTSSMPATSGQVASRDFSSTRVGTWLTGRCLLRSDWSQNHCCRCPGYHCLRLGGPDRARLTQCQWGWGCKEPGL